MTDFKYKVGDKVRRLNINDDIIQTVSHITKIQELILESEGYSSIIESPTACRLVPKPIIGYFLRDRINQQSVPIQTLSPFFLSLDKLQTWIKNNWIRNKKIEGVVDEIEVDINSLINYIKNNNLIQLHVK